MPTHSLASWEEETREREEVRWREEKEAGRLRPVWPSLHYCFALVGTGHTGPAQAWSRMSLLWEHIAGSLSSMTVPIPCIMPLRWCKASCRDCLGGAQPMFVGMPMRQQLTTSCSA
uniref:Uncharacterized protein n=1 Tax=Triticum urartu TaxID=4572 RepID=A0A8R7PHM7_TRIUA